MNLFILSVAEIDLRTKEKSSQGYNYQCHLLNSKAQFQRWPEAIVLIASTGNSLQSLKKKKKMLADCHLTARKLEKHSVNILCHQCCEIREDKIQLESKGSLPKKGNSIPSSITSMSVPCQVLPPTSWVKSCKLSHTFSDDKVVSILQPILIMPSNCKIENICVFKMYYTKPWVFESEYGEESHYLTAVFHIKFDRWCRTKVLGALANILRIFS